MKRKFLVLLMLCLTLGACQKEEEINTPETKPNFTINDDQVYIAQNEAKENKYQIVSYRLTGTVNDDAYIKDESENNQVMTHADYAKFCHEYGEKPKFSDEDKNYLLTFMETCISEDIKVIGFDKEKRNLILFTNESIEAEEREIKYIFVPVEKDVESFNVSWCKSKEEENIENGVYFRTDVDLNLDRTKVAQRLNLKSNDDKIQTILQNMVNAISETNQIKAEIKTKKKENKKGPTSDITVDLNNLVILSEQFQTQYGTFLAVDVMNELVDKTSTKNDILYDFYEYCKMPILTNPENYEYNENIKLTATEDFYVITLESAYTGEVRTEKIFISKIDNLIYKYENKGYYDTFELAFTYNKNKIKPEEKIISNNFTLNEKKPVIYVYSKTPTDIQVKLETKDDKKVKLEYPVSSDGVWNVKTNVDGTITYNNKKYNYLYWEDNKQINFKLDRGYCIEGKNTAAFLEYALDELRLNEREMNDFITYWLPEMVDNKYNIISFNPVEYYENYTLSTDKKSSKISVYMIFKESNEFVDIEPQHLSAYNDERSDITVVEWGGSKIN